MFLHTPTQVGAGGGMKGGVNIWQALRDTETPHAAWVHVAVPYTEADMPRSISDPRSAAKTAAGARVKVGGGAVYLDEKARAAEKPCVEVSAPSSPAASSGSAPSDASSLADAACRAIEFEQRLAAAAAANGGARVGPDQDAFKSGAVGDGAGRGRKGLRKSAIEAAIEAEATAVVEEFGFSPL
jgi:hypothetical protein